MALNTLSSKDTTPCLSLDTSIVSDGRDNEAGQRHKEMTPTSLFNESSKNDKAFGAFDEPLSVIMARGQGPTFSRLQRLSELASVADIVIPRETSAPPTPLERHTGPAMPPTPPETPTKDTADLKAPAMTSPTTTQPTRRTPQVPQLPPLPLLALRKLSKPKRQQTTKSGPHSRLLPKILQDQPEYPNPHFGDPCTHQALDHLLGCGHTVITFEMKR